MRCCDHYRVLSGSVILVTFSRSGAASPRAISAIPISGLSERRTAGILSQKWLYGKVGGGVEDGSN